jgi:peptidoglycan/LPS O-acetylase OafA/YrhL
MKYIKQLDGIRAIAALMVMFFHFFRNVEANSQFYLAIKKISIFGQTGVSLFFVLSGFLITRILLSTKEKKNYFKNFYLRRALRIFPLYYLFLIIYYFLIPLISNSQFVPFNQQIYYWIYIQNFATTFNWKNSGPDHFWSLAVEEHFYLFWPLMVYFIPYKKIKLGLLLIIVLAFISRLFFVENNIEVFYFTLTRMDELALGALLASFEKDGELSYAKAKTFLISIVILIIPTIILWIETTGKSISFLQVFKFNLISLIYFCLVGLVVCLKNENFLNKILRSNFFIYTGKISYGLYVYHPLCFFIISVLLKVTYVPISFFLSFLLTYLIASISYYFYESYFISLKRKFAA